jgi:hypothetical protein
MGPLLANTRSTSSGGNFTSPCLLDVTSFAFALSAKSAAFSARTSPNGLAFI